MRKKITTLVLAVIFLTGASILLYPSFSNWMNQRNQSRVAEKYLSETKGIEKADYSHQAEEAVSYNEYLKEEYPSLSDANVIESKKRTEEYDSLLNIGENGVIGILEIPAINVYLPIYHGTEEEILQVGIGHYIGSSLPIGGEGTHSVLTGHRGLPSAKLLTDIDKMAMQDKFYVHVLDETLAYEVEDIRTVLPTELDSMNIAEGTDYVTLVTCTPYGINTHRLLVTGKRIPFTEEVKAAMAEADGQREKHSQWFASLIPAVLVVIIPLSAGLITYRRQSRRRLKHQIESSGNK